MAPPRRAHPIELTVTLACVALGSFVLFGSLSIDAGSGYDRIGPRLFPYLVGAGLLLSGAGLLRSALEPRHQAPPTQWRRMLILAAALVASAAALERVGFIATASVLFWLVARAFESERPGRDAGIGLGLSIVVYVAFTRGLGLSLPAGILSGLV